MGTPKTLLRAIIIQKTAEFFLLAILLAMVLFFGKRYYPHPEALGIFFTGNITAPLAIAGGAGAALAFYLFTLYPIVTLLLVILYRKFLGENRWIISGVSALISLIYVLMWVEIFKFDFQLPYWAVTAIMVLFIYASSVALYPPRRVE
jgi:hypothetical protein